MPEMPCLFFIDHFRIGNGSPAHRAPVSDPVALIDPSLFMHLAEHFRHSAVTSLIHRETLPIPVAGGAQLFELIDDAPAILFFPLPCLFQKAFPAQVVLIDSLFFQVFDDLDFRGDAGMIRARLPESVISLHPFETDQDILHGVIQRVSHMQLPRDIRRGDHDGKRFPGIIHLRVKIFPFQPSLIDFVLDPMRIVGFRHLSAHLFLLFFCPSNVFIRQEMKFSIV